MSKIRDEMAKSVLPKIDKALARIDAFISGGRE